MKAFLNLQLCHGVGIVNEQTFTVGSRAVGAGNSSGSLVGYIYTLHSMNVNASYSKKKLKVTPG